MRPAVKRERGRGSLILAWAVETEASTRTCALIRIGLALLLWARWAQELVLAGDPSPRFVAFSLCFFAATTAMLFGIFSRLATAATAAIVLVMVFYVGIATGRTPWAHHHTTLLAYATALCALTPCGRSYSVDRWRALRRAERGGAPAPGERGNLWGLRLLALQVSAVYLWSAFDKTNAAFLSGERLESMVLWFFAGSDFPSWPGFHEAAVLSSWTTVALEYALGVGLLWAPTRRWLLIPGLLFHGILYLALPVMTFSLTMWLLYLAYLDPDRVHRAIDRLQMSAPARGNPGASDP